eukprot:CAMPEP_0177260728 /NCGR_PEP_ID=MMETSP0367-20130122/59423_1 /TAXON_ID=447022 ORGANISM="Scrippsiella hangoei-like, Strain SHHI-4" /NCGR_SAMPLE_ID=MMETSP0367 /ASSEMBLY_ACC=CAM_ASM_000362 /LENGTH=38 /DNA_ID= /DNA_START= /DNA_END= /DNA_ORIENTATION=
MHTARPKLGSRSEQLPLKAVQAVHAALALCGRRTELEA